MGLFTLETDSQGYVKVVRELPSFDRRYRRVKIGHGVTIVCRRCKGCDIRETCKNRG